MVVKGYWRGVLPQCGEITAGVLRGWRYSFLQFVYREGRLWIDLRCTPPGWPFHTVVRFDVQRHRLNVRAVPGERARRLEVNNLIERAIEYGCARTPFYD